MASKEEILEKIKILVVREFDDPNDAFNFFDKDSDGVLNRNEIKALLKEAKINRFLQGIVADALIKELDNSDDEQLGWAEFDSAIAKLIGTHGEMIASTDQDLQDLQDS